MRFEPTEEGIFVKAQGFGRMEVAAAFLVGGAAGVEEAGTVGGRKDGEVEFLEGGGGDRWNFGKVADRVWGGSASGAECAVRGVLGKLEGKKAQCQVVETTRVRYRRFNKSADVGDEFPHAVLLRWLVFRDSHAAIWRDGNGNQVGKRFSPVRGKSA